MKITCKICNKPFRKNHRRHIVRWRVLWLWTRQGWAHHDCNHPELGPQRTAGQRLIEPLLFAAEDEGEEPSFVPEPPMNS